MSFDKKKKIACDYILLSRLGNKYPRTAWKTVSAGQKVKRPSAIYQEPLMWQALHQGLGDKDLRASQAKGKESNAFLWGS